MTTDSPSVLGFPVPLSPSEIDRELAAMWKKRGGSEGEEGGVTRIALGNVVWLGSSRHAPRTRRIFAKLVAHYPCRLFLLEFVPDREDDEIESFINAHCFLPQDLRREVCCEEIHLRFGRAALPHVPAAVRSLLLPDVPTCLWYYSAQPEVYETILPAFESMADRIVTEIAWMDNSAAGMRQLAESRAATSLAWYLYAPVRDQIAAIFDEPQYGRLMPQIAGVRIGWCGDPFCGKALVSGALLAGWLASRLGWKAPQRSAWPYPFRGANGDIPINFARDEDPGDNSLRLASIEFHFATGDCFRLQWSSGREHVERVMEGPSVRCPANARVVAARVLDEAEALGQAMNSRADRRYFREAATLAWPLIDAAMKGRNA